MKKLSLYNFSSLLLSIFFYSTLVEGYKKHYVYMCQALIGEYNLNCGKKTFYACRCTNPVFMTSLINCLDNYNLTQKAVTTEVSTIVYNCNEYGNMSVTTDMVFEMYEENKDKIITTEEFGTNLTMPLTAPITFSAYNLTMAKKSITMFYWQLATGENYGYAFTLTSDLKFFILTEYIEVLCLDTGVVSF